MMGTYSGGVDAYESLYGLVLAWEVPVKRAMYGMAVDHFHPHLQTISMEEVKQD